MRATTMREWSPPLAPRQSLVLLSVVLLLASCSGGPEGGWAQIGPGVISPVVGTATPVPQSRPGRPKVEVVADGLETPWAMAFAPDGRLFVTERPGRIRVIAGGRLTPEPVAQLSVAQTSEGGLMGLALDPNFAQNGHLYVMYTYREGGRVLNRVSRLTDRNSRAGDEKVLLEGIPGAANHNGGRVKFGPDGKLYATAGEAGQPPLAQELGSLGGKILRVNPDGSIPADNPFPNSPVYSLGHRNPQGLAWHPETGVLYGIEHGPSGDRGACCHDEVNVIRAGSNYGWPVVFGQADDARFVPPLIESGANTTWAPAGGTFYWNGPLREWHGNLFFTTLRGEHLHRVTLRPPDYQRVEKDEPLYRSEYGRLRDAVQGPDGALYLTTSNRDGRGRPRPGDDKILRIVASD